MSRDARARRPVRRALLAAALGAMLATSCAEAERSVPEERARLAETAATQAAETLGAAIERARRALTLLARRGASPAPSASARGGREAEQRRILDALDAARAESGVDGILADSPSGERLSAGRSVDLKDLPAKRPWQDSFASGDVVFHAGPFLRAVVVSGRGLDGGTARASVILADPDATPLDGAVERRWALAGHVTSIRILPPETLETPAEPGVVRLGVPRGARTPVLAVEVVAPDDEVVVGLSEARRLRREGRWLLVGGLVVLLAAAWGVRRAIRPRAARIGAALVGAILVRVGLGHLDLPTRFPSLEPAFQATDYGITGVFGWLSTPADLAATGVTALLVALALGLLLARASEARRRAVRVASAIAALLLAVAACAGWLRLVESATTASRLDVFSAGALRPSLPTALVLTGLCAATAGAFVLCRAALRRLEASCARMPRVVPRALGGLGIALAAWALPMGPYRLWACLLVPGAAAIVGRLRGGDARPGAPSRVLLTSVLCAVLLVPVLFEGSKTKERDDRAARLADWVSRASVIDNRLDAGLSALAADPHLAEELSDARRDPAELGFYVWLQLGFQAADADGALVIVRNATGRRVSRFALNTPPPRDFPRTRPPTEAEGPDVVVERMPGVGSSIGCIAGHLRVRGADDVVVGSVSVLVADPLALALAAAGPGIPVRPSPRGGGAWQDEPAPLTLRLVSDGRVVASNDPRASAVPPPGLPPASALSRPRRLPSDASGRERLAVDAGARGILVAESQQGTSDELLFGVARTVIVSVGLGLVVAIVALVAGLRRFRARLQDKILASYLAISVVPLVFLGYASWTDVKQRSEEEFRRRQEVLVRAARDELSIAGIEETPAGAGSYASLEADDVAFFRGGDVELSSLSSLIDAELVSSRLPGSAYRATELDRRQLHVETSLVGGTEVRTAYAPMLGRNGLPFGTVAVPLRYDPRRAERAASETGSVLLAAYLLTLVLVVVIGMYTARGLARPLGELLAGTRRVAAGELSTAIPRAGADEIGQLISAFNAMTADLAATRDLAARAEREAAWRGMARQVAHEIKNPLTPMKLLLQQLAATARSDPAYASEMIQPTAKVVLEQIDALSRIASDFSAFARFPPRTLFPCDVNEILRSVVALYGTAEAAHAEVVGELDDDLPRVTWDEDELRRVFVNLVANAVQALDERKGRVRIVVRTTGSRVPETGAPAVLVTVTDDGVGIRPEDRARLFEPDFSTKTHGTGLGLAICRRIVTDLAGEIRIDSAPDVGTTVSVWLPTAVR